LERGKQWNLYWDKNYKLQLIEGDALVLKRTESFPGAQRSTG
jgi:hypothetical protein